MVSFSFWLESARSQSGSAIHEITKRKEKEIGNATMEMLLILSLARMSRMVLAWVGSGPQPMRNSDYIYVSAHI